MIGEKYLGSSGTHKLNLGGEEKKGVAMILLEDFSYIVWVVGQNWNAVDRLRKIAFAE